MLLVNVNSNPFAVVENNRDIMSLRQVLKSDKFKSLLSECDIFHMTEDGGLSNCDFYRVSKDIIENYYTGEEYFFSGDNGIITVTIAPYFGEIIL